MLRPALLAVLLTLPGPAPADTDVTGTLSFPRELKRPDPRPKLDGKQRLDPEFRQTFRADIRRGEAMRAYGGLTLGAFDDKPYFAKGELFVGVRPTIGRTEVDLGYRVSQTDRSDPTRQVALSFARPLSHAARLDTKLTLDPQTELLRAKVHATWHLDPRNTLEASISDKADLRAGTVSPAYVYDLGASHSFLDHATLRAKYHGGYDTDDKLELKFEWSF